MRIPNILRLILITAFVFLPTIAALADDKPEFKETYYANAIALGHGLSSQIQITITRWTTEEERELLLTTLVQKGQEEMINVLKKQGETGFLRLPNTLGYRLYYAREIRNGSKRQLVLATDRPVNMAEAWRNGRSMDYAITMVNLELDENDEGSGWMGFAIKLKPNQETKTLEIENYGTDPVQLKAVKRAK